VSPAAAAAAAAPKPRRGAAEHIRRNPPPNPPNTHILHTHTKPQLNNCVGRSTGQAFVVMASEEDGKAAFETLNKKHLGSRYIE
jgi:RNA recognition motif-containing protein